MAIFISANSIASNLAPRIEQRWDERQNAWIDGIKTEYIYGKNDRVLTETISYWNSYMSEWKVFSKIDYTYNGNELAYSVKYNFHAPLDKWLEIEKTEYTREGSTEVALTYTYNNYVGKTEDWVLASKTVTEYAKKIKKSSETSKWDAETQKYKAVKKSQFVCNKKGNVMEEDMYYLDKSDVWQKEMHVTYAYDSKNRIISKNTSDHCKNSCCNRDTKTRYIYN